MEISSPGRTEPSASRVTIPQELAWRLFTKASIVLPLDGIMAVEGNRPSWGEGSRT